MDKDKIAGLLRKFNTGEINRQELSELENLVEKGIIDMNDIQSLKEIDQKMDSFKLPEPGTTLDETFYKMLAGEKARTSKSSRINFDQLFDMLDWNSLTGKLAYTVLLIFAGLVAGFLLNSSGNKMEIRQLSVEIQQMHEMMMISMLEKPSATERLKAVSLTSHMDDVDNKVIEALLNTLNHDENVNVRLATVDALLKYAKYEKVRKGMVEAIVNQDSPMVQVALADAMVALQEKSSVKNLRKLLNQEHLNNDVKDKINESIRKII